MCWSWATSEQPGTLETAEVFHGRLEALFSKGPGCPKRLCILRVWSSSLQEEGTSSQPGEGWWPTSIPWQHSPEEQVILDSGTQETQTVELPCVIKPGLLCPVLPGPGHFRSKDSYSSSLNEWVILPGGRQTSPQPQCLLERNLESQPRYSHSGEFFMSILQTNPLGKT